MDILHSFNLSAMDILYSFNLSDIDILYSYVPSAMGILYSYIPSAMDILYSYILLSMDTLYWNFTVNFSDVFSLGVQILEIFPTADKASLHHCESNTGRNGMKVV